MADEFTDEFETGFMDGVGKSDAGGLDVGNTMFLASSMFLVGGGCVGRTGRFQ